MRKLISLVSVLLAFVIAVTPLSVFAEPEPLPTFEELTQIDISKYNLPTDRKIKIACVGDSITHGQDERLHPSYPSYLQDILGDGYEVGNFGLGGTTLQSAFDENGNATVGAAYMSCEWYQKGLDFNPDVVIIMLGTNDSGDFAFKRLNEHYAKDYQTLIDSYKALPSNPLVFVATSPYLVAEGGSSARVNRDIVPYQRELFPKLNGVDGIVDIYSWSEGRYYLYTDAVHYSPEGYYSLAIEYARKIFGLKNGYNTYTVKAVPGAVVTFDKKNTGANSYTYSAVAGEDGIAYCYGTAGDYSLTVRAEDFARYTADLSLTASCDIECNMVAGDHNVALFRPVTASTDTHENAVAERTNDRSAATCWQPKESDSTTSWLLYDLGETKEIHGIVIESWFQAYASGYNIEVSDDGENFTRVATVTDGKGNGYDTHYFNSASGRYVRVNFTQKGYWFNFEIYDLQLLSNDERTVSQRELDYIAEEEAKKQQQEEQNEEETPAKKPSALPWLIADAAIIVVGIVLMVVFKKEK